MKKKEIIIENKKYEYEDLSEDKEEFNEIIANILDNLTSDYEKDSKFLLSKVKEYKNHEFAKEIRYECYNIMIEKYPNCLSDKENNIINDFYTNVNKTLEKADHWLNMDELEKANDIIYPLVKFAEHTIEQNVCKVKNKKMYEFNSVLEEIVFRYNNPKCKNFEYCIIPYPKIFRLYAFILTENDELEIAKNYWKKVLTYNPCDIDSTFNLSLIYYMKNDYKNMRKMLDEAIKLSYSNNDVASYYRGLGYYFLDNKNYKPSQVCFLQASKFDNEATDDYLFKNCSKNQIYDLDKLTNEEICNCCKKYNIPMEEDLITYNRIYKSYFDALRNPFNNYSQMIIDSYSHFLRKDDLSTLKRLKKCIEIVEKNWDNNKILEKMDLKYQIIQFGNAPQFNLDSKEKIDWYILYEEDDKMFVMSKYILDAKQYNNSDDCSWEQSSLRHYLNGEFIKNCFSKEEAKKIIKTKIDNSEKSIWTIDNCKETEDYVFCLNMSEIQKYFPNKNNKEKSKSGFYSNKDITTFANYKTLYEGKLLVNKEKNKWYYGNSCFWTRSVLKNNKKIIAISENGSANNGFDNHLFCGIRPAMWLKKNNKK